MTLKSLIHNLSSTEEITPTGIDGVDIFRLDKPYKRTTAISQPYICFIIQGQKTIYLGKNKIDYDEKNYLIGSAKVPIESELKNASPKKPVLGIGIAIDPSIVSELLFQMEELSNSQKQCKTNLIITSCPIDKDLENSLIRLLDTVKNPLQAKILGPNILREIYFYILNGKKGHILKNCVINHAKAHRIMPTIKYIEKNFKNDLDIKQIAEFVNMSPSALHEHFKEATSLSPIQFIKVLRLHHAHNLVLEGRSAGEAAFDSGYNSQSQFSREFKRHFGYSPKDAKELRQVS